MILRRKNGISHLIVLGNNYFHCSNSKFTGETTAVQNSRASLVGGISCHAWLWKSYLSTVLRFRKLANATRVSVLVSDEQALLVSTVGVLTAQQPPRFSFIRGNLVVSPDSMSYEMTSSNSSSLSFIPPSNNTLFPQRTVAMPLEGA